MFSLIESNLRENYDAFRKAIIMLLPLRYGSVKAPFGFSYLQKKEESGKEKASIEDSAFEALEKDFQDVSISVFLKKQHPVLQ